jgi:transposase InsO family protein
VNAQSFIEANKAEFPVSALCRALEVSRSNYYDQAAEPASDRTRRDQELGAAVKVIFADSRGAYGSPRVHAELVARGEKVGRSRIARLMREQGLLAKKRRRFKRTTDSNHHAAPAPDLLRRQFSVPEPNRVWVSDLTYIRTIEGWLYLAVFLDLFSRRVVGWALERTMDTEELVLKAFRRGVAARRPHAGLIVHSDRGSQYASEQFREELKRNGCLQSMSRKGDCFDNAVAESFFDTFKTELDLNVSIHSEAEVRAKTFPFIEGFYNRKRRHSTLAYLSPLEHEQRYEKRLDECQRSVA